MLVESRITKIYLKEDEVKALKKAKGILAELSNYYNSIGLGGYVANNYALSSDTISCLLGSNLIETVKEN